MEKLFPSMSYNGKNLDDILKVLEISRPPTAAISNETRSIGDRGLSFKRHKRSSKIIKVKVWIETNILGTIDTLNDIFSGHQAKLFFGDQPDRYYLVVLSKFGEPSRVDHDATLTLEFESFDGMAHSTTYKVIDTPNSPDQLVFDIDNKGNEVALPIITIKNEKENGYISLVNETAAMELGNREEIDGKIVENSVMAFDYRSNKLIFGENDGFAVGEKNREIKYWYDNLGGAMDGIYKWDRVHLELANYPTSSYSGAANISWPVTDTTLHERVWWRQVFVCDRTDEFGYMSVVVTDEEDQLLYGATTTKNGGGRRAYYDFYAADGHGGFRKLQGFDFQATEADKDNPFNHTRGYSQIARDDAKLSFYWFGINKEFNIPEIKGKKAARVTVSMGGYKDRRKIEKMYLDDIFFIKNKVTSWSDIPNRYVPGSTIVINSENRTVTVNGIEKADEVVDGSLFPKIPKGKSQMVFGTSSWLKTPPKIKIEFEERWS